MGLSGAVGILTAQSPAADGYISKRVMGGSTVDLPVIAVHPDILSRLGGATIRAGVPMTRINARGANVAGLLAGTNPELRGRPLVITAHYDGVEDDPGRRLPSSADNASGVAVVLEVARVMSANAVPPRRPILFAALDAEEVGALGSKVHAAALGDAGLHPLVINLDMAGRFNEFVAAEVGPGAEHIVAALDRAGEWLEVPLAIAQVASDNRRYAWAQFPAVGLGLGAASYHTPGDIPELVEDSALTLAGRLLIATTWQLAWEVTPDARSS